MKRFTILGASISLALLGSCEAPEPPPSQRAEVLIFSKTAGFRHGSIPTGVTCLTDLAANIELAAVASEDSADFNDTNLERFAAVIFLSTTMDVLNEDEQASFERYIQAGGGYVGIHAATDTEYDWPWYTGLAGAQFSSHPKIQPAVITKTDEQFAATSFLPERWERTDEWYNFKEISPDVTNLLMLDESSYEGGENGDHHPAAWYHEYDGGRAFYTAGGHTKASYAEPLFRRHVQAGLAWAASR
jgi:type 1 glutamine amidotransferase